MAIATAAPDTLRAQFAGSVLAPADAGFDDARRVHNGMIDRRPALVARCHGTADVQAAVRFAREHALEISVRGGGHNVAGNAVCDGGESDRVVRGIRAVAIAESGDCVDDAGSLGRRRCGAGSGSNIEGA